jgi:hypothetical protein
MNNDIGPLAVHAAYQGRADTSGGSGDQDDPVLKRLVVILRCH